MVVINNMWTTIRLNLRQNRLITFKKGNVNSRKRNPLENLFFSELSGIRETKRSILRGLNTICDMQRKSCYRTELYSCENDKKSKFPLCCHYIMAF